MEIPFKVSRIFKLLTFGGFWKKFFLFKVLGFIFSSKCQQVGFPKGVMESKICSIKGCLLEIYDRKVEQNRKNKEGTPPL